VIFIFLVSLFGVTAMLSVLSWNILENLGTSWNILERLELRQNERTAQELNIMVQQSQEKVMEEAARQHAAAVKGIMMDHASQLSCSSR